MRRQLLKQKSVIQQILLKARGYRNSLEFIHLLQIYQIVDSLGQIPSVRLSEGFCINANWMGDQYCSEEVSPECQGFEDNAIQITLLPIMLRRLVKKCLIWSYKHQKSCTLVVMKILFISMYSAKWQLFSMNSHQNWKHIDQNSHLQTQQISTNSNITEPDVWKVANEVFGGVSFHFLI